MSMTDTTDKTTDKITQPASVKEKQKVLTQIRKEERENISQTQSQEEIQVWVEELLEKHADDYAYLQGRRIDDYTQENGEVLFAIGGQAFVDKYAHSLREYHVVDNICDIRTGTMVRRLSRDGKKPLTAVAILKNMKFSVNHTLLSVMMNMYSQRKRFMKYSMTNFITFQKWTQNEMMILLANGMEDDEEDRYDEDADSYVMNSPTNIPGIDSKHHVAGT